MVPERPNPDPAGGRRWRSAALRLATAALAAAMLGVPERGAAQANPEAGASLLERASTSRAKGRPDAPVLVYEIADFQCPYCARFANDVAVRLDSAYVRTGKVQWVFVNLPLPNHTRAWAAAEAAACAGAAGGRFWPMHDRLFQRQQEWAAAPDLAATFRRYARELGVPADPYRQCVESDAVAPMLLKDILYATAVEVTGTPTFLLRRGDGTEHRVVGMKSFEEWQTILEGLLPAEPGER